MYLKHGRTAVVLVGAALLLAIAHAGAQTASNSPKEVFLANAVNNSNIGRPGVSQVEIDIDRWSTPGETEHLLSVFNEKGPKALLTALQKTPRVGYIKSPGNLSYDLHYARELPGEEGGRRIVLGTDRPIGFFEATESPRTVEYPFTIIELRLNKDNKGEGKLSYATKITSVAGVLVLENYADQPIMLTNVHKEK